MEKEKWVAAIGYEGKYEVSDFGNVRSLRARNGVQKVRVMKPGINGCGYPHVGLRGIDGTVRNKTVHSLVLSAFRGPRPDGHVANHIDGIKTNNLLSNLEWVTRSANALHSVYVLGNIPLSVFGACAGENNGRAKLSWALVRAIRERLSNGERGSRIARDVGVRHTTISMIKLRRTWNERIN